MKILLRYLGTLAAVICTITFVPGVSAPGGWQSLFLVALIWSAVSFTVKPLLHLLTLPITLLTFGMFSLVINALLFWLVSALVPGFVVQGFVPAFVGSIVLSISSWVIHTLVKPRGE